MGRWGRLLAAEFVEWLSLPSGLMWVEVGCGTGALTGAIVDLATPLVVHASDPSDAFLERAREAIGSPATFASGDATAIDQRDGSADVAVAGLALNFVPDQHATVREMTRVVRPGGTVAAYVWDYAAGMEFLRTFWDAAIELDPAARELDEGVRFPTCRPDALERLWREAGLRDTRTAALVIPTAFRDFDDLWAPFLGGQGPAPGYLMSLTAGHRERLRGTLQARLRPEVDGTIRLRARAWAVRAVV